MDILKYRKILRVLGRNPYASRNFSKIKPHWIEADYLSSAGLQSNGQIAYKDAASLFTRLALFRFSMAVTIVNLEILFREGGATMERCLDSQNFWAWIGGVSIVLFLFVGNTESTGLLFILAIIPAVVSIFFAFLLLKVIFRFVSNASYDLIGHLQANLRPNEFLRNRKQTQLSARRLYHASPRST